MKNLAAFAFMASIGTAFATTNVVTVAGTPEDAAWNRLLMLAAQAFPL
jgi:hypothetical protein